MLPFTFALRFMIVMAVIMTPIGVFAQTSPDTQRAPDEFQQTVRETIDSLTHAAYTNLAEINQKIQAVEVQVNNNGSLDINGTSVDLVNPMQDILNGVEKLTRAAGIPDANLNAIKEQVNELPAYLKTGWDWFKELTNTVEEPTGSPAPNLPKQ